MSPVSSPGCSDDALWQPVCPMSALRARARVNAEIRCFFAEREVLEVETPLLCRHTVTDPGLQPFETQLRYPGQARGCGLYLQTSPEFAMKRLLAAGAGSIFQICKAFRNEESGRQHNPEFTLLEWYRTGFALSDLMDEVESLVARLFREAAALLPAERYDYVTLCEYHLGLNPLLAGQPEFMACSERLGLPEAAALCGDDRSVWLDLLFSHAVQPHLGQGRLTSVYHYPDFMPSLARNSSERPGCVERVEVFLSGMELGNGFHELSDAGEQAQRFERDRRKRREGGLAVPDPDGYLLAALEQGLPDCSGMAIGLDRLLMVMTGAESIAEVLSFPVQNA